MTDVDPHRAIEATWRLEAPRLIGALVRMTRDVALAEDLAQDALESALATWPEAGVPSNPGAWLMAVAKRRAIDGFRRRESQDRAYDRIGQRLEAGGDIAEITAAIDHVEDDVLRLMFICCHPALSPDAQVTLTLRLLAGLTTREIARAFLTSESAIAARITRGKKTLADVGAPMEEPAEDERAVRITAVLGVLYLLFNEGYSATEGEDWMRPALCEEALRLARILAEVAPGEAEVHGLAALLELQSSRSAARTDTEGEPVLLRDQDRAGWDQLLIRRGLAALERANALGTAPGPYVLQTEIAACHARADSAEHTNWTRIAELYAALGALTGSAIVELNRAVALSFARGPGVALAVVEGLADHPDLASYHLLPSVRGDLLTRLGRRAEAVVEFERAAALTENEREKSLLLERAEACRD